MLDIKMIKSKRFSYFDVMETFNINDYAELKDIIDEWIATGKIIPIKKNGVTSFIPRIYSEYKKIDAKVDYTGYEKEIRTLHPYLDISRYLKNPRQFMENEKEILKLSEYLWKSNEAMRHTMSVKERSYDIWRDEKFLESAAGRQICSWNHLDREYLNYFYAPESFFFIDLHENSRNITALVIENKDTWYSLGKALKQSEKKTLCNIKIDILIYGEGNKATKPNAVCEFIDDMTIQSYQVLYVGDIDIAGIDMLYRCSSNNQQGSVKPFIELYKQMLLKVIFDELKFTDDNRGLVYEKTFLEYFTVEEKMLIKQVLNNNKRIPQEILNYSDYLDLVR